MRKCDVAFNPPLPNNGEIKKPIEEMDVDELQKLIGTSCVKCRGDFTVCESCKGCLEGRLIIDKLRENSHKAKVIDGIMKMKNLSPAEKQDLAKQKYHDALMSDDPVKFIMVNCHCTEKQAKSRMYNWKIKYPDVKRKVDVEKAYPDKFKDGKVKEEFLPKKKMVELVPKKEQTVDELVAKLQKERNSLKAEVEKMLTRVDEINSTLRVIKSMVG